MHDDLYGTAGIGRFAAPREQRVEVRPESNMLRMGLIAGGIAALILMLLSLWSWIGHRHGGVPVVDADTRPARERPLDQGGLKVDGANEAILSGKTDSKPNVTAAPEAPALAALRASPPPSVAAIAPPSAPQAVIATPQPTPGVMDDGVRVSRLGETPQQPLLNASRPPAAQPVAPVAQPAPAAPAKPNSTVAITGTNPARPVAKPETAPTVTAASAPAKIPVETKPTGQPMVQLGALPTQAGANAEWARLEKKNPELLGSRAPVVSPVSHDGKSLWRLRVGGFEDKAAANKFCAQVKSAGGQCIMVPNG